ncbi:MAG: hypothetical protein U1F43_06015 [Myxococcota bacterium]
MDAASRTNRDSTNTESIVTDVRDLGSLPTELAAYRAAVGDDELRFECKKDAVPRKLHLVTRAPEVVSFFSTTTDVHPAVPGRSTFADR